MNTKEIMNNLSEEQNELLARYFDSITEYNNHTNITRITSQEDFINKHVIDSLLPFDDELNNVKSILDVGSGAGFPGIVLAIIYPNIKVTLIDSNGKKTKFLNKIVEHLELKNVDVLTKRAEEIYKYERESFDIVTARAVSAINILIELLAPYVKLGGKIILLKGPKAFDEIKEMNKGYKKLGLDKDKIKEFEIDNAKRIILIFNKIKETNSEYPRQYAQIKNNPLN